MTQEISTNRKAKMARAALFLRPDCAPAGGEIAVVTLATRDIWEYAQYGVLSKAAYTAQHGYDFYVYVQPPDESRPPAWSKLLIILEHLSSYSWVFWTDADSLIMNPNIGLGAIIGTHPDMDMLLTAGPIGPYNTGQWLVKNSSWSRSFIKRTWDNVALEDAWMNHNPWEQQAFALLCQVTPHVDRHIAVLPLRQLNSRPSSEYLDMFPDLVDAEYRQGDFLIHFYHTKSYAKRVRGMRKYYLESIHATDKPSIADDPRSPEMKC